MARREVPSLGLCPGEAQPCPDLFLSVATECAQGLSLWLVVVSSILSPGADLPEQN